MAPDEELLAAVRRDLSVMPEIEEKSIIGGLGFMWRGNLLCGVRGRDLMVRVAKSDFDSFIGEEGAKPMVMAGKSGKSWILVDKSRVSTLPGMKRWLGRAIEFVGSLPGK